MPIRNQTFESNGPDGKIRGTAQQVFERYVALGRDASSSGDPITAEGYFQHAEHYFRLLHAAEVAEAERAAERMRRFGTGPDGQPESVPIESMGEDVTEDGSEELTY